MVDRLLLAFSERFLRFDGWQRENTTPDIRRLVYSQISAAPHAKSKALLPLSSSYPLTSVKLRPRSRSRTSRILASFSSISIAVDLINLGKIGKIPPTTAAAAVAAAIPHATYSVVEDASHYSMFAECKPHAPELAASAQIGDPICADGGGRSRADIHAQLINMVVNAFDRALKPTL